MLDVWSVRIVNCTEKVEDIALALGKALWFLWAKKSKPTEMSWLPLPQHLADAAHIARFLWRSWLSGNVRARIAAGWADQDTAERVLIFLAATHDLGKATPAFQSKPRAGLSDDLDQLLMEALRGAGLPCDDVGSFHNNKETHHAIAGHQLLRVLGCNDALSAIIGAHHGKPPTASEIVNQPISAYERHYHMGEPGKNAWGSVQGEVVSLALTLSGYSALRDLPRPTQQAQVLLSGLVIMADWIASNQTLFPYLDWGEQPQADMAGERARAGWAKLRLTQGWQRDVLQFASPDLYLDRFGISSPYLVQSDVLAIARQISQPGILIIEAPMGAGKTEAALVAAEVFAEKAQSSGVFFALPTQATSNAMFSRIHQWTRTLDSHARASIRLAHGKAQFNESYSQLLFGSRGVGEGSEDAVVHQWFEGNKKSMLADFVVGTIDQFLLSALRQKHVMLRHLGLAGKVVILDECHAYDAYMNRYLDRALRWMGAYGVPVIVLSATLPAKRRTELVQAYTGHSDAVPYVRRRPGQQATPTQMPTPLWKTCRDYPLITCSDGENIIQRKVADAGPKRRVSIQYLGDDELIDALVRMLPNGGYAGVVLNTVPRAQKLTQALEEVFGASQVTLSHARFTAPERARKEDALLKMLGKPKDSSPRTGLHIVVGTQVLEQSLDVDFDVLITDLCPMDLLLQRMGRLHRHQRIRPPGLDSPRCFILGAMGNALEAGTQAIYHAYPLLRTRALLPKHSLTLPDDIPTLVQDVYDSSVPLADVPEDYERAMESWQLVVARQQGRAGTYLPKPPSPDDTIVDWTAGLPGDALGEASVRDGGDSVEVLVIMCTADGVYSPLPWADWRDAGNELKRTMSGNTVPDEACARLLARQSLRLPPQFCYDYVIQKTIQALEASNTPVLTWQQSPWLKGQLFLVLDQQLRTTFCGHLLTYSEDVGLVIEEREGTHERNGLSAYEGAMDSGA